MRALQTIIAASPETRTILNKSKVCPSVTVRNVIEKGPRRK